MNKTKLYHYSNKNFGDKIRPEFFGDNSYTRNDAKYPISRSFFYLEDKPAEKRFEYTPYLYIAEIGSDKLYDLRQDPEKLKENFDSITELLVYLKKKFTGIIYNVGFNIVSLFEDIDIKEKITRRDK